jgi:hypothetical protein
VEPGVLFDENTRSQKSRESVPLMTSLARILAFEMISYAQHHHMVLAPALTAHARQLKFKKVTKGCTFSN